MTNTIIRTMILVAFTVSACTNRETAGTNDQKPDSATQATNPMKNMISIVEIPAADFSRASVFYQSILNIKVEVVEMEGIKMGLFPQTGDGISIQVIHGGDYKPSSDGVVVYLNGGDNLQLVADKITANGGKIIIPKTGIGPEMGFYATFIDTEGNKLGLHSMN
jgi:predicted enzyme related to lactoylglutathione lyase